MNYTGLAFFVMIVAMAVSAVVFPPVLKYAKDHDIVDNPNARKLQRVPVPVMGGVVVYCGIITGVILLSGILGRPVMLWGLLGMTVMLIVGVWDDIKDISAILRLLIEIAVVGAFMWYTGFYIDSFHGLWGVYELHPAFAIPFSLFVGVGVINAVNLIDGVDGYASGYGILACGCFALMFWSVWSPSMVCLAMVVIGALIPFFMHNVFGVRSKMFIGDGGTLMMGMLMVALSFYSISSKGPCAALAKSEGAGLAAFCLAVLCIPVFDTIRVMTARILRGRSPFSPDKTHLHHMFIDMGFSHLGAGVFILFINLLIVGVWLLLWKMGASIDVQTYVVLFLGVMVTTGFYKFMKIQQNGGKIDEEGYPEGTRLWYVACRMGDASHFEKGIIWRTFRWLMDGSFLGGGKKVYR
ncbi:MAG: undecaprenyl/decaprenyl-phosphate alpha-N-acetylglucosaminyl 1-phosphate transferase [Prevotella sp.]|nr:undecaprenyl/decaprenyl-phosphate alpha-N-acetylglucosaminyl 1-phosphate transferase [Prevotella sp.]